MPKQKSIIKLSGTVDDMTFYQSQDGFLTRKKTSVTGERIANDPKYERTRENNAEFGRAGKATKLFRGSIKDLLKLASDSRMASRLTALMVKVVKTDPVNLRRKRTVTLGDTNLLHNFQCNSGASLIDAFTGTFTPVIDRAKGTAMITIDDFIPRDRVTIPEGATHFKFISAATELNFTDEIAVADQQQSVPIQWDFTPVAATTLSASVTPAGTDPIFLLLGMQFFQVVNGKEYPLKDESFNPLSIIEIDTV